MSKEEKIIMLLEVIEELEELQAAAEPFVESRTDDKFIQGYKDINGLLSELRKLTNEETMQAIKVD